MTCPTISGKGWRCISSVATLKFSKSYSLMKAVVQLCNLVFPIRTTSHVYTAVCVCIGTVLPPLLFVHMRSLSFTSATHYLRGSWLGLELDLRAAVRAMLPVARMRRARERQIQVQETRHFTSPAFSLRPPLSRPSRNGNSCYFQRAELAARRRELTAAT